MKPLLTCPACHWTGEEHHFQEKLLSVMYRAEKNSFDTFTKVGCPKCKEMVTILFGQMAGDPKKCGGI